MSLILGDCFCTGALQPKVLHKAGELNRVQTAVVGVRGVITKPRKPMGRQRTLRLGCSAEDDRRYDRYVVRICDTEDGQQRFSSHPADGVKIADTGRRGG